MAVARGGTPPDMLGVQARPGLDDLLGGAVAEELPDLLEPLGRTWDGAAPVLEEVPYASGSPATGALVRLRGADTDGAAWSAFCKVVQHVRHWRGLAMMPPPFAQAFAAEFPWRTEIELWDALVLSTLPDGLRAPLLLRTVDMGEDRVAVWQEDVRTAAGAVWDLPRYRRAAELLGRWNARCAEPDVLATSPFPPGHGLRMYAQRSVPVRGLVPLADDDLWSHPWLREHTDIRAALLAHAPDIPAMLDRLDTMRQCLPHGDASPQNLLVPADSSADLVVIDLSFRTPHALGFDLGQLLVGLTHAGEVPAARLPDIADAVLAGYLDGLHASGVTDADDDVRVAFTSSALLRSGFDGFLYETLDLPGAREGFDERVAMARFLAAQHGS